MLYAIGGVPRSGKTALANRLHAESGFSVLTTDAIVVSFMAVAPELHIDYGHPDRRRKIAPGLKAAVQQIMNNNEHFVLEGELLNPWLVEELQSVADVRSCFLSMSKPDIEVIVEHEQSNAWVGSLTPAEQRTLVSALQNYNDEVVAQCQEHGVPHFDISAGDYEVVIDAAFRHLVGSTLALSA
jgi:2-phosphoglycerate kinase